MPVSYGGFGGRRVRINHRVSEFITVTHWSELSNTNM